MKKVYLEYCEIKSGVFDLVEEKEDYIKIGSDKNVITISRKLLLKLKELKGGKI